MTAPAHPLGRKGDFALSVEGIRILATVLLVLYHVIGIPGSGLRVSDGSSLRIFADLLADFRMPAFAFVAGFVYALRPLTTAAIPGFMTGKLQRLAVPGLIAAAAFALVSNAMHLSAMLPIQEFWRLLVFPYAHYWFLQSILLLFFILAPLDALSGRRAGLPLLAATTLLYLLPLDWPHIFSLNGAFHLAPFFMAGICYYRHRAAIEAQALPITLLALVLLAGWGAWTTINYVRLGTIDTGGRQIQALIFAVPACVLMLFYMPHIPHARLLGRFSFTIYLYHVFGTAGMRVLLHKLGIGWLPVHLVAGLSAGLFFPILLHLAAMRSRPAARLLLGLKPRAPRPAPEPEAAAAATLPLDPRYGEACAAPASEP